MSAGTVRLAICDDILIVIMTVCLMRVGAASKLLDIVELLNLCIEQEQFIINCYCILILTCGIHLVF